MKIIVLGAGQVGSTLTEQLCQENDVTVIDLDADKLRELQARFDIRTVCGHAGYPITLVNAGIQDAELLIAVTGSDESNMVACQVANSLFNTPIKIARIRGAQYASYEKLFSSENEGFSIDYYFSPESLVIQDIKRLIQHPETLEMVDFDQGIVHLVHIKADHTGEKIGQPLLELENIHADIKLLALFRNNIATTITSEIKIESKDEIIFLVTPDSLHDAIKALKALEKKVKYITIAGGGNIGGKLATALEDNYNIKLIEQSKERAQQLSFILNKTIILNGDATDRELLLEENVGSSDIFCVVTNKDETNVMSAILAKRLGAHKVMALVNHQAFIDIASENGIDNVISPKEITIGSILEHILYGNIVAVHSLRRGTVEVIEFIAHEERTPKLIGKKIADLSLPAGIIIGAIIRQGKVKIANDNLQIMTNDHVILFIKETNEIRLIKDLF